MITRKRANRANLSTTWIKQSKEGKFIVYSGVEGDTSASTCSGSFHRDQVNRAIERASKKYKSSIAKTAQKLMTSISY
jgi:hypothetical protein